MKGYSTREVAELIDLPQETIREIAHGVLNLDRQHRGRYRFSFQDIVVLRTARELLQAGVRRSRINRTLIRLSDRLPRSRPLTSYRISGDAGEVVIQEDERMYSANTGQYHFNFSVAELAGTVAPLAKKNVEEAELEADHLSSDDWFDLGVDLEAVSPEDAPTAYMRALELDPKHSDAHVNLGRLKQEAGDLNAAEHHYRQALEAEPDNVLAAFNLGTLMEDMGRVSDAIDAYKRAQNFSDAHYNLSRLYELIGEHAEALKHLKIYRAMTDPDSPR